MKKLIVGIVILILLVPLTGYLYLRSYLADYETDISAPGLQDEVSITRNQYAVPTITARNFDDLYFAWGYVNAQDRMFQMEVIKRIGQGRISEFAGEDAVTKDIFLRAVGFSDIARQEAEALPPYDRRLLQRFVDGINHYLDTHRKPLYFVLAGLKKEKWSLSDPLLIAYMLNWSLAYNMKHELLHQKIIAKIGAHKCRNLLKLVPPDCPVTVGEAPGNDWPMVAGMKLPVSLLGSRSASNNWVVAPEKTAFSGPLLANDPHVHGSKIPSDFYLIRLKMKDFDTAGAQVAGLPFIAFGYNRHAAWGITNQGADVIDVFIETIDWEKKTFLSEGRQLPLKAREVEIAVKNAPPVRKTLYYAGRRPLLTEVFPDLKADISIDWAGYDSKGFLSGFLDLNRVHTHTEFLEAVDRIHMSPQNMVYADTGGNIAYRTIGTLLNRIQGTGNIPQPASQRAANWDELLDPGLSPAALNPPEGFIASANNRVVKQFPYDMNATFAPRFRYERIAEMLRDSTGIDLQTSKKMQNDTHSVLARRMTVIMKELIQPPDDPKAQAALELVTAWNGDVRADLSEPSIFNTWLMRFMYQTFKDELGEELAAAYVGERYLVLERFLDLLKEESPFFNDVSTEPEETASDMATRAFAETLEILTDYTGSADIREWQWGQLHHIRFDHMLGKSSILRPLVNRGPYPFGGDGETNLRAHFKEIEPPYTADLAAGFRMIVAFDPEPRGHIMLITGQNEYFLSRHYDDMTALWLGGKYFSFEEAKVRYQSIMQPE